LFVIFNNHLLFIFFFDLLSTNTTKVTTIISKQQQKRLNNNLQHSIKHKKFQIYKLWGLVFCKITITPTFERRDHGDIDGWKRRRRRTFGVRCRRLPWSIHLFCRSFLFFFWDFLKFESFNIFLGFNITGFVQGNKEAFIWWIKNGKDFILLIT
jgi:hypothetical protein